MSLSRRPKPLALEALGASLVCAGASLVVVGCANGNDRVPPTKVLSEWPMPDADVAGPCADVGALRVCWSEMAAHEPRVVPRRVPPASLSALGFRCVGTGKDARCIDRGREAPPFHCEGNTCRQQNPRLPDDGEWECADFASVVVCHGGERAAGVPPGSAAPGYSCGPRRGVPGERVCVDLSPDMPTGTSQGYLCHFEVEAGLVRICNHEKAAHTVNDPCDAAHPCDPAFACEQGRCLPPLPSPSCWLDRDCDNGACRIGTCAGASR